LMLLATCFILEIELTIRIPYYIEPGRHCKP
jgi:hypothetical protein